MLKNSKFISNDNQLFRGHLSLFKSYPRLSPDDYTNSQLKGSYRACIGYLDYPKPISLLYIFDSMINYQKRFNRYWLSLKNIYRYYSDFEYLDKILTKFKINPTKYFSELNWMAERKLYPVNYDKHLGCNIPDTSQFDLVIKFINKKHGITIKDTLINLPIIDGWQQVYLENNLSVNRVYDDLVNRLNLRAISNKDLKLVDKINSFNQLTLDDKRLLIYTIYNKSDSCYLKGNFYYWMGMVDHNNQELKIIGKALGYWINFDELIIERNDLL